MYPAYNPHLTGGRIQWPESAPLAADAGFPGVDIRLTEAMRDGLETTKQILARHRLTPAAAHLGVEFRKDDETFRKDLRLLPEASSFAAAIGCPRMITSVPPSTDQPKARQRALITERLQICAGILAQSNVRLGLEFLSPLHLRQAQAYEFIWCMEDMLALAKGCGENCGLTLDSWHWYHAGATTEDIIAAGKERIVHVHLSDAAPLPPEDVRDGERLLPGEGVIPFEKFLPALQQIGYEDGVSIEVFGRGLADLPPEQGARLGFEAATRVMNEALCRSK